MPQKAFNPDDLFLDGGDEDDFDEDDTLNSRSASAAAFLRHVRGIVALSLTLLVLAIVAGWAMTDRPAALAQANLAWRASAYDAVAFEDYQNGRYLRAAVNYERALSRDGGNYTYANNAAIAYYQADDAARSAEMAERAIEIDPTRTDAYEVLCACTRTRRRVRRFRRFCRADTGSRARIVRCRVIFSERGGRMKRIGMDVGASAGGSGALAALPPMVGMEANDFEIDLSTASRSSSPSSAARSC